MPRLQPKNLRRCVKAGGFLVLGVALTCATPRPVQAQFDPATISTAIDFIKTAYSLWQFANSFINHAPAAEQAQTVVVNLKGAVNDLEAYINKQRDMVLLNNATTGIEDVHSLSLRAPGNAQNTYFFDSAWSLIGADIDAIYNNNIAGTDPTSSYALAPLLNELGAVWIGLLNTSFAGQIPGYTSVPWGDYQARLNKVMQLDYVMVGARSFMCWPQYNPWAGGYVGIPGWENVRPLYSELYLHLAPNRYLDASAGARRTVNSICVFPKLGTYPATFTCHYECNLKTRACRDVCVSTSCASRTTSVVASNSLLANAHVFGFKSTFDNDPVVKVVREGMKGLLSVGGGDEPWDNADTYIPEAYGVYNDPWVWENACGAASGYSAYPATP